MQRGLERVEDKTGKVNQVLYLIKQQTTLNTQEMTETGQKILETIREVKII